MASKELDKSKSPRPSDPFDVRAAEEDLSLQAYLRKSVGELDLPKSNQMPVASRLGREPKPFNPAALVENPGLNDDEWGRDFDDLAPQRKGLFRSVLPYFAVAIVCGGISGGALLYFLLHYAGPDHPKAAAAVPPPPVSAMRPMKDADASERAEQRQVAAPAAANPVSKLGSSQPSVSTEKTQDLSAETQGLAPQSEAPSDQPAPNGKPSEAAAFAGSFAASVDANPKDTNSGSRIAALAPAPEAAPVLPPVPSARDLRDVKPAESGKPDPVKPDAQLSKVTAEQEDKMLKRASILLSQNDIAGARLIFQYLANHGSAAGAFALAESYDPKKWAGRRVTGMEPDAGLARVWYTRAAALGSKEAAAILRKDKP